MSRTKRVLPYCFLRHPKKNVQSKDLEGIRVGTLPPHEFDDLKFGHDCYSAFRLVHKLHQQNKSETEIVKALLRIQKMSTLTALDIVRNFCR